MPRMKAITVIFLGRSGSGKGTQVEKLTEHLSRGSGATDNPVFHLESGKRFREFIAGPSYAAKLSKEINEAGGLQPEFLSVWAWTSEMVEHLSPEKHLLVDGSPRRVQEARVLESALAFFKRQDIRVVYIKVSRDWATKRLLERGRADDLEVSDVEARMNWFEKEVEPVVKHFSGHPTVSFAEIDGEKPIDEVHKEVLRALGV